MKLIHIVAMANNGGIGKDGELPWHIPSDLAWFKEATTGRHCIVGRKTYESLPESVKKDPNRKLHVVSRSGMDLDKLLGILKNVQEPVMIIGGSEIYSSTLDRVDEVWATHIDMDFNDADTYYPIFKLNAMKASYADRFLLEPYRSNKVEVVRYLRIFKSQP